MDAVLNDAPAGAITEGDRRDLVLRYVQPGLAGLIDGSVSTLAPLFATAFATHSNRTTLLVGLAAAVGAGISMGITEGMSDDGRVSGRGSPWTRGAVCGGMTAVGGLLHALPYLVPDAWPNGFLVATVVAAVVVVAELLAICHVRARYMATPFSRSLVQILLGGALVLATGIAVGSS